MKILINVPDLSKHGGGVANHFNGLLPYWSMNIIYNKVGKRRGIPSEIILIYDYLKFILLCTFYKFDLIVLNPSLGKTAIQRDTYFLNIAKLFNKKTVVFFHGWNQEMAKNITLHPSQFSQTFNKAEKLIVLSKDFKDSLQKWGINIPIEITTTKVDDSLIKDFKIERKEWNEKLLFLARIESAKGIFITLDIYKIVKSKFPKSKLSIAGDGSKLNEAKDYAKKNHLQDVSFLGNISGSELIDTFSSPAIYILPTQHGEGMPTSVLEAMAFGLPIISRPVGGIVDFFEEKNMGHLINSLEPKEYAIKIINLFNNTQKLKAIGTYNHRYAKERFIASKVADKLEGIFRTC